MADEDDKTKKPAHTLADHVYGDELAHVHDGEADHDHDEATPDTAHPDTGHVHPPGTPPHSH